MRAVREVGEDRLRANGRDARNARSSAEYAAPGAPGVKTGPSALTAYLIWRTRYDTEARLLMSSSGSANRAQPRVHNL